MTAKVYLRVDDYPGTKPEEFGVHNYQNFKLFHSVVRNHFPSYVLGIIPKYLTLNDVGTLKQLSTQGMVPALHGVDHDETKLDEFGGLSTEQTISRIGPARDVLERLLQVRVVDYIPPHNVFHQNTAAALRYLDFKYIYGGPGSPRPEDVDLGSMEMRFSVWPWAYGRSDELLTRDNSPQEIAAKLEEGVSVWLTLHWTWEVNIGLSHLRNYLDTLTRSCSIIGDHG